MQAYSEKPRWGSGLCRQSQLKGKPRLRVDCVLWWFLQWDKLLMSHKSPLESALETSRWAALFPLWSLHYRQRHSTARKTAPPMCIPKALPPYNSSLAPRQRNMAQMKDQNMTSELSNEEITNVSDGEFKTLVIKMLTDLMELGWKMKKIN